MYSGGGGRPYGAHPSASINPEPESAPCPDTTPVFTKQRGARNVSVPPAEWEGPSRGLSWAAARARRRTPPSGEELSEEVSVLPRDPHL
jgi:hypothetical protein